MIGRVVEVMESGRSLSTEYGSLIVRAEHTEIGRIDLDEIAAVIVHPYGVTITSGLMARLAELSIPLVVSRANYEPNGLLLPLIGNHQQARRIEAQLGASKPTNKRLWQALVRSKIKMQAASLEVLNREGGPTLRRLAAEVQSGDPSNLEGQAARYYWIRLLGRSFRRDRDLLGANALLNYGYAILRSSVARATVAAGLHPSISIQHRNQYNGLRLVDDLMEPFRPLVDLRVHAILAQCDPLMSPENKRNLVQIINTDVPMPIGTTPLGVAVNYLASSIARTYMGELAGPALPIDSRTELIRDFATIPVVGSDLE